LGKKGGKPFRKEGSACNKNLGGIKGGGNILHIEEKALGRSSTALDEDDTREKKILSRKREEQHRGKKRTRT